MEDLYKPIKVRIDKKLPMSKDGFLRWGTKARPKVNPYIFKCVYSTTMETEILATDKALGEWFCEHFEPGQFNLFRFVKAKTKFHVKPYLLAKITIHDNENNRYTIEQKQGRLNRSYFRRNINKNKKGDTND